MTREQKITKRKLRAKARMQKGIDELREIRSVMRLEDISFRAARNKVRNNGRYFQCEMRYSDCEARGYCNGDC